jgi:hypothetical protein
LEESGSEFVVILYRMPAPGRNLEST